MKEFDIKITETLERTIKVEAENKEEAQEKVKDGYYNSEHILDSEDFKRVDFNVHEEREIQQEMAPYMDVLLVKPGMYPQEVHISGELGSLQKAVDGRIEAVYPFNEEVALIVNDMGKFNGSELNRALKNEDGEVYDIIAGNFLVVGLTEEDFGSLSPELMKQFEEKFHQPENFVRMGRSTMAVPMPDDKVRKADMQEKLDSVPHKISPQREVL